MFILSRGKWESFVVCVNLARIAFPPGLWNCFLLYRKKNILSSVLAYLTFQPRFSFPGWGCCMVPEILSIAFLLLKSVLLFLIFFLWFPFIGLSFPISVITQTLSLAILFDLIFHSRVYITFTLVLYQ